MISSLRQALFGTQLPSDQANNQTAACNGELSLQMYQGLRVYQARFSGLLGGSRALIAVDVFLFLDHGNVTNLADIYTVTPGTMKFNIEIDNWDFCGTAAAVCSQGGEGGEGVVGRYLVLEVGVRVGRAHVTAINTSDTSHGLQYDLGGARLTLSNQVTVDGSGAVMPGGYPRLVTRGSQAVFQLRFPRATHEIRYDPLVQASNSLDTSDNPLAEINNEVNSYNLNLPSMTMFFITILTHCF